MPEQPSAVAPDFEAKAREVIEGHRITGPGLIAEMAAALRSAYDAGAEQMREKAAQDLEDHALHYPEDVFVPGGESKDAIVADAILHILKVKAADLRALPLRAGEESK